MQELVDTGALAPRWRDRRVPSALGGVKADIYRDRSTAFEEAKGLNLSYRSALASRDMDPIEKRSLELKVMKSLQAKERLQDEETLMLTEAVRRHQVSPRPPPTEIVLSPESERFREDLSEQLTQMPYLNVVIVGRESTKWTRKILFKRSDGSWETVARTDAWSATRAERAKIANGFDLSATAHWGLTKARIREILLPRANQLLKLASVQRLLAEALARGEKVLVSNGIVFWYEEDGGIGWQIKMASSTSESEGSTLWHEGTIRSTNHGRLVILPYIKENGEEVRGHTKNGPNDGPAKPRHPEHYVDIRFKQLAGDLMIGLLGELPYE
jgi:hypothetical protein